ncbi:hypothetical protein SLEP1_g2573 [Rubroshorea leprosula]|uniref:Subtilisin-like protease SBT1.1 n=1 Tax=Rubroshorea leprosula TaxID=152421 RepID=A0AAV5HPX3_9ROSI|nr:hypothetical protein SLEP1_g2573 [Rubroshorea leprosula]
MMTLVLVAFMATNSVASVDSRTYIVHMDKSKMKTSYLSAANSKEMFEEMLDSIYQLSPDSEATPPPRLFYAYDTAIFGFAAKLSPMHLESIRNMDAFMAVIPDGSMRLHTTYSYKFLGLEQGKGLWHASNLESDVIIGVIDAGIWPEHPSFQDHGFGPVPAKWKGACESGTNFSPLNCNRKLIGARYFFKGYEAFHGKVNETANFKSPRATNGHGTHCASTAGGNLVQNASFYGLANGVATGMRYTSRIAAYKVCWEAPANCASSDILAAIDQAIKDGVDVVSISLGLRKGVIPYFDDLIAQAAFSGIQRGIFFSLSAGNKGPRTVVNTAPWLMTVAASYIDRSFPAIVKLGNGQSFEGISLYPGKSLKESPIVYGPTAGKKFAQYCIPGSLSPKLVKGKVVVCELGGGYGEYQITEHVKLEGGVGTVILHYEGLDFLAYPPMSPAVSVGDMARKAILSYLNTTKSPTASLTFKGTAYGKRAPMMAAFSSRGPNLVDLNLLKPDLTAPGVNILAAWPGITSPSEEEGDKRRVLFNLLSGTSMACPHVSGLAALLVSRHKEWSPAAVKSAMMTTAYNLDNRGSPIKDVYHGGPATPFAIGSGHVDIQKASDPGLLYDIHPLEYLLHLCSLKYNSSQIARFDQNFTCPKGTTMQPGDLNYPSFVVRFKSDAHNVTITYRRTVTNVGNPPIGTYKVQVQEPKGISVRVNPSILSFKTHGEKLGYKVSFTTIKRIIESENSCFGSLTWVSGKYMVRSPIAVTWI